MERPFMHTNTDITRLVFKIDILRAESQVVQGHTDRVGGVAWHPEATLKQSPDAVNLVSGAGDLTLCLWSLNRSDPFFHLCSTLSYSSAK